MAVCTSLLVLPRAARAEEKSPRITPVVEAVQEVLPAVVNISTQRLVQVSDPFQAFYEDYFSGPVRYYRQAIPLGSGVAVDDRGLIITNYHVIRRATNVEVLLWPEESVPAQVVAVDATNDLALLQIEHSEGPPALHPASLAIPDDLLLGETVVAVGNPFGLGSSVTTGVLSAINRTIREGDVTFDDILQTDAAVNPGNSGGPLINLEGEVIGLNLAIRRGAEGIGFAIPLGRIENVLAHWLVPSQFSDSYLGLVAETKVVNGRTQAVVGELLPGSPALDSGLEAGDVIRAVNRQNVARAIDVGRLLWRMRKGDTLTVELTDGRRFTIEVRVMNTAQLIARRLRLQVQDLNPPLKKALGLPDGLTGVTVSEALDPTLAKLGVNRGDILYRVNDERINDSQDLWDILKAVNPGDALELHMLRTRRVRGNTYLDQYVMQVIVR